MGVFGGVVPDLITLAPSVTRGTGGAYFRVEKKGDAGEAVLDAGAGAEALATGRRGLELPQLVLQCLVFSYVDGTSLPGGR